MKFIMIHMLDLPQKLEMEKFKMKEELFEKIRQLTIIDLKHKTENELLLSLFEEIGEISREILITEKIYGNTYKKPSEDGVLGEAVDSFICSIAMHFANKNEELKECEMNELLWTETNLYEIITSQEGPSYLMSLIPELLCNENYFSCAKYFYSIYYYYSDNKETAEQEFISYCNKKLDKWINKTKEQT